MRIFHGLSAVIVALVLVGCEGDARPFEEAVEVRTQNLTSIAVVPPTISVDELVMNIGESVQFGVNGTSAIGQQVTLDSNNRQWQVTDESVASINDNGQLVARANGDVGVFISIGGLESATYDLRVSDALLTEVHEIVGEPILERCLPMDYQATGLFADGTVRDLSGITWTLAIADVNNARLQNNPDTTVSVTALNTGNVTLTAALGGFSRPLPIEISDSLESLSISPTSASLSVKDTTKFAAFGAFAGAAPGSADADASTTSRPSVNVTESVNWQITGDSASVSNSQGTQGIVTGLSSGTANLSVSCGNLSAPVAVVTVSASAGNSDDLSFSRTNPITLRLGAVITLSVSTGSIYNSANSLDNDDLTWDFSPDDSAIPAIKLVDNGVNAGQITALNAGESGTITVTDSDGATGSIRVEVAIN